MEPDKEAAGIAWQTGVWNRISDIYLNEIDRRFARVVDKVIARAQLTEGQHVLDLGTGTAAWDALAGVTTAHLPPEHQHEAKAEVLVTMYPHGDGPRHFRNVTQFILGQVI